MEVKGCRRGAGFSPPTDVAKILILDTMSFFQMWVEFVIGFKPCFSPGGGTLYDGLYVEVPPERGTFFRLQV